MRTSANFEKYLTPQRRGHSQVLSAYLSREEQKRRFLARLDEPEKNWKFSEADVHERQYWDDYMNAYEDMIRHTASRMRPGTWCPPITSGLPTLWSAPPSSRRWSDLDLQFPKVDKERRKQLEAARQALLKKKN